MRYRRRSSRVFAWFAGAFLALQLGGGWLLDNVFPVVRCPVAYNHFGIVEKMLASGQSPSVVYFGSSRFNSCLHAGLLTKALRKLTGDDDILVLSGSGGGGDMLTAEFLLNGFLERGARPRLALVEILPETVNHVNHFLNMQIVRQLGWSDVPTYFEEACRAGYLGMLVKSRFAPLYVHRYRMCKLLAMGCRCPILGIDYGYPYQTWDKDWEPELIVPDRIDPEALKASNAAVERVCRALDDFQVGGNSMRALRRLMKRCEEHDIAVLFVAPPLSAVHRAQYTPEIEARFAALLEDLNGTPNCRVVDARDRLPDALFLDNHHANEAGMLYFTRHLCRETLVDYWRHVVTYKEPRTK